MAYFLPSASLTIIILSASSISAAEADPNTHLLLQAKSVLAQLEGEIAVPGLTCPVEVLRDQWGVAHIYAANQHDLFFAQGFVAAQDRLFQIDMWRRIAVGETAEVLGEGSLVRDHFARLTRYRGDLDTEWTSYAPDTKRIVTAFTQGINAYIDHVGEQLPIEFQILKYKPKKWTPQDCLGRMSVLPVALNLQREVERAELVAAVGLDQARLVMPTDPPIEFSPAGGLDLSGINESVLSGYDAVTSPIIFSRPQPVQDSSAGEGSNNWVVDGTLSASGKPMLASDPHRSITLPSLRYLVHLNAPGWNVIGSGEPALPGVAIGHNEHIAWGFTIVTTDQADLFVEQTNPVNPDEYRVGDQWEPMTILRESVSVRKNSRLEPVPVELRYTRHGPVIHEDRQRHLAYALRWVGSEPGTAAYLAALSLDRASDWDSFLAAVARWKTPSENLVYADVDGSIGWVAAALTPIRRGWHGLLPVPGASGEYRWHGFLQTRDLPQSYNPPAHYIVTANHNILPTAYPHEISYDWIAPFRYRRAKEHLESKRKFTLDDFQRMQYDNVSIQARELVRVLSDVGVTEPLLARHVAELARWDGRLAKDSTAASLFVLWRNELTHQLFALKCPEHLIDSAARRAGATMMLNELREPSETWFGEDPRTKRDALVRESFARSLAETRRVLGDDTRGWGLGKLQHMLFQHPLAARDPVLAKAFNIGPFPSGSGPYALNQAGYDKQDFSRRHGPTYRHVLDLADWDKGLATSAPGQSGQPGSPHYADLAPLWNRGEYFPLAYSREKIEKVTRHRLLLKPTS